MNLKKQAFAKFLKAKIASNGHSYRDVAKITGITAQTISNVIRGNSNYSVDHFFALAGYCNASKEAVAHFVVTEYKTGIAQIEVCPGIFVLVKFVDIETEKVMTDYDLEPGKMSYAQVVGLLHTLLNETLTTLVNRELNL